MPKAKVRESLGERLLVSMRQAADFLDGKDVAFPTGRPVLCSMIPG